MKANRMVWMLVFALSIFVVALLADYFRPAELQIDLNAPRFRLVRKHTILPDQKFEMEWKHMNEWVVSTNECLPVFGQRTRNGIYAWEIQDTGSRFERIFSEALETSVTDPYLRTNVFYFHLGTRDLPNAISSIEQAQEWAKRSRQKGDRP